jgi:hypothetical protein
MALTSAAESVAASRGARDSKAGCLWAAQLVADSRQAHRISVDADGWIEEGRSQRELLRRRKRFLARAGRR